MNRRQFNQIISAFSLLGLSTVTGKAEEKINSQQVKSELFQVAAQKRSGQPWINYPTRTIEHLTGYKLTRNVN
jgi:hypothetical protein